MDTFFVNLYDGHSFAFITSGSYRYMEIGDSKIKRQLGLHHLKETIGKTPLRLDDLELLEPSGWWACLVFPMASNIQFVFYRSDVNDRDIIFKVLLNEEEARLPLLTDIAPYYHWSDFRDYYLLKLDAYSYQTGKKEVATGKAPTASNTFSSNE